ncbi:hypothetical protein [Leucobacter musarum]|uniref:hypothetical protein n=1 Tax=Leucobacter musarum TaxID=1930747 RepID=UPI000A9302BB|nr:hypothetical protein [Leucobacter musarum]
MTGERDASEPDSEPTPSPEEPDRTVIVPSTDDTEATVVTPRRPAGPRRPSAPLDETIVTPKPSEASTPLDRTVVTPRPNTPETPVPLDHTVVTPRPLDPTAAVLPERPRGASFNPAPPVADPAPAELPPEIAARMFKSPLDAKYRIPDAPTEAPSHALPRRGVSPALPVITSSRAGRRNVATSATDARIGAPPESRAAPPEAQRHGLRSTERANRRFGTGTVIGFGASLVVAVGGLWIVAILAFG